MNEPLDLITGFRLSLAGRCPARSAAMTGMETARRFWRFDFRARIRTWGFGFVLPTVLFFAVFKYGPMLWALELSFTSYDMVSQPRFVGLDNYRDLVVDPIFRETLVNTLVYIGGSTVLITLVALALALAINTRVPGARHCMMAMFLTNLMPIIAVCLVWRFLLHPHGLISQLVHPLGFDRVDWLTSSWTAMPCIILVTVWRFAPYFMVVFIAGLLAIPDDYYEAAHLDGANPLQRFWYITLPLLTPMVFFVVVVAALLSARIFLMPFIITGGGPGNATRVLSMLIYETGFSYLKMGRAAAISAVLFAIMMIFTFLQMRFYMEREEAYIR
jgi:multiple sugar transport system permease protein